MFARAKRTALLLSLPPSQNVKRHRSSAELLLVKAELSVYLQSFA